MLKLLLLLLLLLQLQLQLQLLLPLQLPPSFKATASALLRGFLLSWQKEPKPLSPDAIRRYATVPCASRVDG